MLGIKTPEELFEELEPRAEVEDHRVPGRGRMRRSSSSGNSWHSTPSSARVPTRVRTEFGPE